MTKTNGFQELRIGFKDYGWAYWLFPMPVLLTLVALMLLGATIAAIIYLPLPLMWLVIGELAILSWVAIHGLLRKG